MGLSKNPLHLQSYEIVSDGDLMCSVEEDGEGKSVDTCYTDPTVRSEPSDMDIKAIMYKYGSDGFQKPNRDMSTNPFFVYTGSIITPAEQELRTNLIIAFGTVAGLIAVGIELRKIGKKKKHTYMVKGGKRSKWIQKCLGA